MISYVVLHYNRPYLLDLHVKLIRKYCGSNMRIIVADDGSSPEIVKKIKQLPIDDVFTVARHVRKGTHGTCSTVIRGAIAMCNTEYMVFAEDDFLFNPAPPNVFLGKGVVDGGDIVPNIRFPDKVDFDIFEEAIEALRLKPELKQIQLAALIKEDIMGDSFQTTHQTWRMLDHLKKPIWYSNNWPQLVRTDKQPYSRLENGLSISSVEARCVAWRDSKFGVKASWAACPALPVFQHMGLGFTLQINIKKGRKISFDSVQKGVFQSDKFGSPVEMSAYLAKKYVEGSFVVDFDQVLAEGPNAAFLAAGARLRNALNI